ncbi:helix-turn-helix transcriptional regulator [Nannocystis pusilla]|uniref:helix-turn-helix transcriptional regulator n=1 Tax=Nannocystis pusilla TaxID=889268 RepID=UPI003B7DB659
MLDRLAQVILVHGMRRLGAGDIGRRASWLRALADPQIGAALRQIHADVGRRWTLGELAAAVGMSRSAFALRFTRMVGKPPLEYAIAWRMQLARDALRTSERPVGELGFALGYASESAFSTAFRREVGESPRAFRGRARAAG